MSIILCIFAMWIGWSSYQLTSGMSVAASTFTMTDTTKKTGNMTKRKTLAQLILDLKQVHGNKYGYELVSDESYKNSKSKIPVICKKHNRVFKITPSNHLYQKQGCPICAAEMRRISNTGNVRKRPNLVFGVGVNDYNGSIKYNHVHIRSYHTWVDMLKRCYSDEFHSNYKTYRECKVCDEWLYFSNFKKWFDENYTDGYALDKDILVKGNKCYSPETCCFVPNEINVLLCKNDASRGNNPVGVSASKRVKCVKYIAYLNEYGKRKHLGTFDTKKDAFLAYKTAKEVHIKEMAFDYFAKGLIKENVYKALMNYEVRITD